MIITSKQLKELRNIREIKFTKIRDFSDYHLACGIEEIDLTNVKGKIKDLLLDFFKKQVKAKRGDRVKTLDIYQNTKKGFCIIEYKAFHGFGYAWSDDLEGAFVSYLIRTYKIKKTSKTYKNLVYNNLFNF